MGKQASTIAIAKQLADLGISSIVVAASETPMRTIPKTGSQPRISRKFDEYTPVKLTGGSFDYEASERESSEYTRFTSKHGDNWSDYWKATLRGGDLSSVTPVDSLCFSLYYDDEEHTVKVDDLLVYLHRNNKHTYGVGTSEAKKRDLNIVVMNAIKKAVKSYGLNEFIWSQESVD